MRIKNFSIVAAILVLGFTVAGCTERAVELWNQSHETEGQGYGDTMRQAMAQQIANPDPTKPSVNDAAVDGERLNLAVGRYKAGKVGGEESNGGTKQTFKATPK